MSVIDQILAHNEAYADRFDQGSLPMPPAKKLAAVVRMDARRETGAFWLWWREMSTPFAKRVVT